MSSLKKFAVATPRPLPVIVLADTSGSMGENGKIEALNAAMKDMVSTFAKESRLRAEIQVGLITFGGKAQMHLPLVAAHGVAGFSEFKADGVTPMGAAFDLARQLLEDKDRIPSRAYRPVLILLSDGQPTDDWEAPFKALCDSERAQKATRLAMAIGPDADEAMLKDFANDAEAPIFKAHNARDIHRFFRAVTMSVTTRTSSQIQTSQPHSLSRPRMMTRWTSTSNEVYCLRRERHRPPTPGSGRAKSGRDGSGGLPRWLDCGCGRRIGIEST